MPTPIRTAPVVQERVCTMHVLNVASDVYQYTFDAFFRPLVNVLDQADPKLFLPRVYKYADLDRHRINAEKDYTLDLEFDLVCRVFDSACVDSEVMHVGPNSLSIKHVAGFDPLEVHTHVAYAVAEALYAGDIVDFVAHETDNWQANHTVRLPISNYDMSPEEPASK